MDRRPFRASTVAAALLAASLATAAGAQPSLVITGMNSVDISANGNTVLGNVFDASIAQNIPYIWTRGVGYTRIDGAEIEGTLRGSADLSVLAMLTNNVADWGSLNCFNGYFTTTSGGSVAGQPRPPASPCPMRVLTHRWTQASDWVNIGSFARTVDAATGRLMGGTHCDATINSPNDISGDGSVIIGSGYWTDVVTTSGGISSGTCGQFRPFRYTASTGAFDELPRQPGTTTARADRTNFDGSIIVGYDQGASPDPDGAGPLTGYNNRRLCVWQNGVQTLLDAYGNQDVAPVNGPGNVIVAGVSATFSALNFADNTQSLAKFTLTDGVWVPTRIPLPAPLVINGVAQPLFRVAALDVSDDGNTVVGSATYQTGPFPRDRVSVAFLWRPTLNGGVPVNFNDYVASIQDPADPILTPGISFALPTAMSADGNAFLVGVNDDRNSCVEPVRSLFTSTYGVLYLNGAPCDPPRIALSPLDHHQGEPGGVLGLGIALNVFASGTGPMNYQWQREDPAAPGTWINLEDSCGNFAVVNWAFEGTHKAQLRIGLRGGAATDNVSRAGRYRAVVSNDCGSVTSAAATVTIDNGACCLPSLDCEITFATDCAGQGGTWSVGSACSAGLCDPNSCPADFDASGAVDVADIFAFLSAWFAQSAGSDFDNSGATDVSDIFAFLSAWFAGCN